jgi:hypothetical protein
MAIFFPVLTFCIKTVCFTEQPSRLPDNIPDEVSPSRYSGFFFEGAAHFVYIPEMFSSPVQPKPGFRGALGYEWRQLRFSLASGYTLITGTNPFVQDLAFIPLTLRFGYDQPLGRNFNIRADLGGGFRFTEVNKYEKVTNEAGISPTVEGRLSAAFTLPGNPLQIYAGGGTSLLFEIKGPVFHPAFEAGLVFKIAGPPPPQPPPPPPPPPPPSATKVRIPLPDAQTHVNFFEVALRDSDTGTVTSVYAPLFKGYIEIEILPGIYDILLFTGNKHSPAGTPLLLATSHAQTVDIVEGQTTDVSMPVPVMFDVDLTALPSKVTVNEAFPAGFTVKPENPLITAAGVFPHRGLRININGDTGDLAQTGWAYNGGTETYTYTGSATISSPAGGAKAVIGFTGNIGMFDETTESTTLVWAYADFEHPELGGSYKKEVTVEIAVEEPSDDFDRDHTGIEGPRGREP